VSPTILRCCRASRSAVRRGCPRDFTAEPTDRCNNEIGIGPAGLVPVAVASTKREVPNTGDVFAVRCWDCRQYTIYRPASLAQAA
jgi:hypothetical protein